MEFSETKKIDITVQLMGALLPHPTGALLWALLGDFRPANSLNPSPNLTTP